MKIPFIPYYLKEGDRVFIYVYHLAFFCTPMKAKELNQNDFFEGGIAKIEQKIAPIKISFVGLGDGFMGNYSFQRTKKFSHPGIDDGYLYSQRSILPLEKNIISSC